MMTIMYPLPQEEPPREEPPREEPPREEPNHAWISTCGTTSREKLNQAWISAALHTLHENNIYTQSC